MDFSGFSNEDLIYFYGEWLEELKKREIIRTNNVVGEIGEFLAVNYYNTHSGLPNMQLVMKSSANIDAISINGERYSIKTTTNKTTGVFYGFNSPSSDLNQIQPFEYVIIVILNKDYTLKQILEIDYATFLKYKRWHSRMSAWNLTVTKKLLTDSKIIYDQELTN